MRSKLLEFEVGDYDHIRETSAAKAPPIPYGVSVRSALLKAGPPAELRGVFRGETPYSMLVLYMV
jgi:hypothetical protein